MQFITGAIYPIANPGRPFFEVRVYITSKDLPNNPHTSNEIYTSLLAWFYEKYGVKLEELDDEDDHQTSLIEKIGYTLMVPRRMVADGPHSVDAFAGAYFLSGDIFRLNSCIIIETLIGGFWFDDILPTLNPKAINIVYTLRLKTYNKNINSQLSVDNLKGILTIEDRLNYIIADVLKLPRVMKKETSQLQTLPIKL